MWRSVLATGFTNAFVFIALPAFKPSARAAAWVPGITGDLLRSPRIAPDGVPEAPGWLPGGAAAVRAL